MLFADNIDLNNERRKRYSSELEAWRKTESKGFGISRLRNGIYGLKFSNTRREDYETINIESEEVP